MPFSELGDYVDWGLLGLRVTIAAIFIVHGWPKLTKSKEMGAGMAQMGGGMSSGAASTFMLVTGMIEVTGAALLIAGALTQVAAAVLAVIMVGAIGLKIAMMKAPFTAMETTGWEFDLILLAALLLLLVTGAGDLALMPSTVVVS